MDRISRSRSIQSTRNRKARRGLAATKTRSALLATSALVVLAMGSAANAQVASWDNNTRTWTFFSGTTTTRLETDFNQNPVVGPDSAGFKPSVAGAWSMNIQNGATIQDDGPNASNETDAIQIDGGQTTTLTVNNAGLVNTTANESGHNAAFTWFAQSTRPEADLIVNNTGQFIGVDGGILTGFAMANSSTTFNNAAGAEIIVAGASESRELTRVAIDTTLRSQLSEAAISTDTVNNRGLLSSRDFGARLGNGEDTFTNFGTGRIVTTGVNGNEGVAIDLGADNDVAVLMANSETIGNVLGQSGDDRISIAGILDGDVYGGDDNDTMEILATAEFVGSVFGEAGADQLTIVNGFDMDVITEMNGGGNAVLQGAETPGSDENDQLFLDRQTFEAATASVIPQNWQFITLRDQTTMQYRDGESIVVGQLETQAGTSFNFAGTVGVTDGVSRGSVLNRGVVGSANGQTGDVLNVGDNFFGNGVVELDAALDATEASDVIIVQGTTSGNGTQQIVVNDVGTGIGAETGDGPGNGIRLIDVSASGQTADGDFVLANGPLQAGAFIYGLDLETDSIWYLQSVAVSDPGVVYTGTPYQLKTFGRETIGTYYERTGTRIGCGPDGLHDDEEKSPAQMADLADVADMAEHEACNYGVWARVIGAWTEADGMINNMTNASYEETVWAVQGGIDAIVRDDDDGQLVASIFLHYGQIRADAKNNDGGGNAGSTDGDAFGGGVSLTYTTTDGLYLDGVATYTRYDLDITTAAGDNGNADADGWAFSGEIGKHFVSTDNRFGITPQMQIVYQSISIDDFTTTNGNTVSISNADSLEGRVGATFEYLPETNGESRTRLYVEANLIQEFLDAPVTTFSGAPLSLAYEDTSYEVGIGVEWGVKGKDSVAVWAEADYRTAVSSDDGPDTFAATAGLAYRF